jgi:hypothetical protein
MENVFKLKNVVVDTVLSGSGKTAGTCKQPEDWYALSLNNIKKSHQCNNRGMGG